MGTGKAAVLVLWALCATSVRAQTIIHVSPHGDDRGDGSSARPLRTLESAQAAVRRANRSDDVVVMVADGIYPLAKPMRFARADGGQRGHSVRWQAVPGARPTVSGGALVSGFTRVSGQRDLYVAEIAKGLDPRQVWVDDVAADRAWVEVPRSDIKIDATGLTIVNPKYSYVAQVQHPERLELETRGAFTDRFSPVASANGTTLTMAQPAWNNNLWGWDSVTGGDTRYFFANAPELFGKASKWSARAWQWYVDPEAGKLYLHGAPNSDITRAAVVVPRLEALIAIAGTPDAPVERLTFRGFRFSYTSWRGPSLPTGYASQQSGTFIKDAPRIVPSKGFLTCRGYNCPEFEAMRLLWNQIPAAVQVSAARDVTFEDNRFSQLGQVALGIGNDANAHLAGVGLATDGIRVTRNHFATISAAAILAGGVRVDAHHPGRPALTNRNLMIDNNVIDSVSQHYRDNAAIQTTYFDTATIAHNDIANVPYDGIGVGWGWGYNDSGGNSNYDLNQRGYMYNPRFTTPTTLRRTTIIGNRLRAVKQAFVDGGAIYNLSDNPETVIRDNYVYAVGDRTTILLDEGSRHIRIENNVLETAGTWVAANTVATMPGGRITADNVARGNWHISNLAKGGWTTANGNVLEGNHLVTPGDWPAEAQKVMREAGVQPRERDTND